MPDDATRHSHYLESLTRLHRGWSHETRSHLGNIALQLDLLDEILARAGTGDAAEVGRLVAPIERARKGISRLELCLDRYLGAAMPRAAGAGSLDLAAALVELGELVEPSARERRVSWSVVPSGEAVAVAGDARAIREALAIAAIGLLFETAEGARIEARVERSGPSVAVRFAGPAEIRDASAWLAPVRAAIASSGGTVRAGDPAASLEVVFPIAPETR